MGFETHIAPPERFVHVTPSLSRLGGGLFESVRHLSQSLHQASGAEVSVLSLEDPWTAQDIVQWAPLTVQAHSIRGPVQFGFSPKLNRALHQASPSLVHLHGLWRYSSVMVRRWAHHTKRPYVLSPHGMLEPWALRQSRWKKRLAFWLYVGPALRQAGCLRATSRMEAESIRRAGCINPIA